jgi:2-polyprenyl-3-methyl-5-hydroxy-6-metoxy-1,4-benzoquinol methylase
MYLVGKIGKFVPKPIREIINQLYRKWNARTVLNKEMIEDLTEFYNMSFKNSESKLSYKEATCLCKIALGINANLWNILNPKTEEEIKKFYEIVPYYPFELAYWHMRGWQRRFRKEVVSLSFGDVLDYGGGIGDLCIELAKKGLNVTYGDVPGRNWEFAKWLFKKRGYNIKMIDLGKAKIPKNMMFDSVICIDTIEHIPNPDGILEDIAMHLKNKGILIITALNCIGKTENNPMHLKMEFDAEKLLNSFGVFKSKEKDWLWIKP